MKEFTAPYERILKKRFTIFKIYDEGELYLSQDFYTLNNILCI